ncbi:MAG: NAD(+) kinase [Prochlorotrichaceae cyanobacterium]
MTKVGIIYNDAKPTACSAAEDLQQQFIEKGWKVVLATGTGGILGYVDPTEQHSFVSIHSLTPPEFDSSMDFSIVLGGDGTVLAAFRQVAPLGIPLLNVNTGHMGFLTETYINCLPQVLERLCNLDFIVEERSMLVVRVVRQGKIIWEALGLNEMVIHREPLTSMCHFEISVGRHAPVDIAADGIIISTPTGSTAYSLSAGGAVVTPDVSVLQLAPICPHSLASRSLIFADVEPVVVSPANPDRLIMVVDGNAGCYVTPEDEVRVERSPYKARFIRLNPPEFFRVLREKLGWGLPHIAKPTSVELP